VDCRFDDSIELLKQVQGWFAAHMPSVKTKIVSLSTTYQHDDPKTWDEIKANGAAAIVGVGHCSTARLVLPPTPSRSRPDTAYRQSPSTPTSSTA